jgi:hypothetical protein
VRSISQTHPITPPTGCSLTWHTCAPASHGRLWDCDGLDSQRMRHLCHLFWWIGEEISEHRAVEGPADERCHHRLSQCREPLSPNQMCERLWTPSRRRRAHTAVICAGLARASGDVSPSVTIAAAHCPRRPNCVASQLSPCPSVGTLPLACISRLCGVITRRAAKFGAVPRRDSRAPAGRRKRTRIRVQCRTRGPLP